MSITGVSSCSYKDTNPVGLGMQPMTSFNLNYHFKSLNVWTLRGHSSVLNNFIEHFLCAGHWTYRKKWYNNLASGKLGVSQTWEKHATWYATYTHKGHRGRESSLSWRMQKGGFREGFEDKKLRELSFWRQNDEISQVSSGFWTGLKTLFPTSKAELL